MGARHRTLWERTLYIYVYVPCGLSTPSTTILNYLFRLRFYIIIRCGGEGRTRRKLARLLCARLRIYNSPPRLWRSSSLFFFLTYKPCVSCVVYARGVTRTAANRRNERSLHAENQTNAATDFTTAAVTAAVADYIKSPITCG